MPRNTVSPKPDIFDRLAARKPAWSPTEEQFARIKLALANNPEWEGVYVCHESCELPTVFGAGGIPLPPGILPPNLGPYGTSRTAQLVGILVAGFPVWFSRFRLTPITAERLRERYLKGTANETV